MATREAERTRMITAEEAAAQLGVKLGTLYAYVSRGWLRSYRRRVGRQALYRREDIDALRGSSTAERWTARPQPARCVVMGDCRAAAVERRLGLSA